ANHTILISKDGRKIPVMDTGAPIYDIDGTVAGVVIAFQDETEKRTQRNLLKASEHRLRSTLDNMMEGCQILGYDYRYLYLNKSAVEQSRLPEKYLLGKTILECYPGVEKTEMFAQLKLCMEKRSPQKMENEFTYPDESKEWFTLSFEPVPEGVFILSQNITQHKKAQEEIRKLSRAIEQSPVSVLITNPSGNIEYVNDRFCEMSGYTREEVIGKNPRILKSGYQDNVFYKDLWDTIRSGKEWRGEIQNKKKEGTIYWESIIISPILNDKKELTHFVSVQEDITERKAYQQSLNIFRTLIDQSNDAIELIDPETGRVLDCNEKAFNELGYTRDEYLELKVFDYDVNLDQDKFFKTIESLKTKGSLIFESALEHKNGQYLPVEVNIKYIKLNRDYVVAIIRDITQRKQSEEKLKFSEEKYRNLVDNALVGVYESNLEGEFTFVNKILLDTLGLNTPEDLKNNKIVQLYAKSSDRNEFINSLKENGFVTNYEIDFNIKGKGIIHTLLSARLKGNKITGMILDVTKKKDAENAMREAKEKAEEMNRLKDSFLANMSHELRTPLIGILGYAELLEQELKDENLINMVNVIRSSGKRLNKTLNNILDISKIESEVYHLNLEKKNLIDPLTEQIKLFTPVAEEKNIKINFSYPETSLESQIDELLFVSIIDNILSNAIKYTVEGKIDVMAKKENNMAVIEFMDTGIGIAEKSLELIFEPFRQVSEGYSREYEGTGLGLSLVNKCTVLMGGTIAVKSEVGKGTTFTLKLPCIEIANDDKTKITGS
ncbi:MAG TPA: PAS domain S-box protein, partial [Ignavibacteriaceae bacterium]|nr:PAS domain S-box protein [Ignavibacteriaceae bacterium]